MKKKKPVSKQKSVGRQSIVIKLKKTASMSVVKRLPRYYRFLTNLKEAEIERISSKELSEMMGVTASQIRQDFNCFGEFGQQGYGYNVSNLRDQIGNILGLGGSTELIIIGAGNLGLTIAENIDFRGYGYNLIGIFDTNPDIIGKEIITGKNGNPKNRKTIKVLSSSELLPFCEKNSPPAAALCIPNDAVKEVCDIIIPAGVSGILNFTDIDLPLLYNDIICENVHILDSLLTLGFKLRKSE